MVGWKAIEFEVSHVDLISRDGNKPFQVKVNVRCRIHRVYT